MAQQPYRGNSSSGPGGGRGGSSQQSTMRQLPNPQTILYFINGQPSTDLVDREAENLGRALAVEDGLKPTQLRRYYDDIQTLRTRLDALTQELSKSHGEEKQARAAAFERLRADFKMLKAKAAYAHGRKLIPERLLTFFINHVHSVRNAEDFEVFFKHFQAVLAFHRFYKPNDGNSD